jgi:hypothetical protein
LPKLKGIIFSVEDTLLPQGAVDIGIFAEVDKLVKYLRSVSVEFVVYTNRHWIVGGTDSLEARLKEKWGDFSYYCRADNGDVPGKPQKAAVDYVLAQKGWDATEVLYLGASENDMRTAVNGGLLFLRATWWANKSDYGFEFDTPKDVARFVDTFCLREHFWCHQIKDDNFEFYSLAPYSTYKPEYTLYSADARAAAKHGLGHPDFWVGALVTSLYFTGIHRRIDYIAVYPGHEAGSGNAIMDEPISVYGKCFRKAYIPDLIVRHTTALKSQTARNKGEFLDHLNQLNTIHLCKTPARGAGKVYKRSPLGKGKTVLLLDDICTNGYSIESARAYIEQTGAKVIMATWLKTINTDIHSLGEIDSFSPYQPNAFHRAPLGAVYGYRAHLVDHLAPAEIARLFAAYESWEW